MLGAFGYSGYSIWKAARIPASGERDTITLVCAACNTESVVSSAQFKKLAVEPKTRSFQCPQCGQLAARIASTRCSNCGRAIPPQPPDAPLACPFCKAPLGPPD